MKDNNLEKHFRDGLRDLEAGPPDGTKDAIEKQLLDAGLLKDKAEVRGGLWMFLLLAVLIATPVVFALKKTHVIKLADTTSVKDVTTADAKNTIVYNERIKGNENVGGSENSNVKSTSITNRNTKHNSEKQERNKHVEKTRSGKISNQTNTTESLALNTEKARNISAEVRKKKEEKNQSQKPPAMASASSDISMETTAQANINASINAESESTKEDKETDKPEEKKDTLEENQHTALKDTSVHPKVPKESIHKEIAFDFSGAPQFNAIKYGNGSEYYQEYVDESKRSEKETPSFSAAFGIVLSLNKFLIETGFKHSILTSDFSFEQTIVRIDTTASHSSSSGWVHVEDSVSTLRHYIATNKIAFMEFPLLLGYRMRAGKFAFELKAGPMMSFITAANTTVISLNTGTVLQSNDLENSPYRKTCWSLLTAGNILYSLNSRFAAFVQPSLKTGITSVFKESAPVTKKVQSVCVGIGLRVKL